MLETKEFLLENVMNYLPGVLDSQKMIPETITHFPKPDDNRKPRSYVSRISFFLLKNNQPELDTVSEFFLLDFLPPEARVWTCHKSVRKGDIIFFVLANSAYTKINKQIKKIKAEGYSVPAPWEALLSWVKSNRKKLFAYSYYTGEAQEVKFITSTRWKYQAPIGAIQFLRVPLDIIKIDYSRFLVAKDEIVGGTGCDMSRHRYISSKSFEILRKSICVGNSNAALKVVDAQTFGEQSEIGPHNWIEKIPSYSDFCAECHVREVFTDELVRHLSDDHSYFAECLIYRNGASTKKYADYVICINGIWIAVEVKFSIKTALKRLLYQVEQYINCSALLRETGELKEIATDHILVVDRDALYFWPHAQVSDTPLLRRRDITLSTIRATRQTLETIMK